MSRRGVNSSSNLPQAFIDDVLARVDIIELVGARVKLKKNGAEYQGCCPFHQEKTPSFRIHPIKQVYHCFGCGESGNALSFVMKQDGLSFTDAVQQLAEMVGLPLPKTTYQEPENHQHLYAVLSAANQYYQQQLKLTQRAIDYLKNRGISGQIAKFYQLGYAPNAWQNLTTAVANMDVNEQQKYFLASGLSIEKNGRYYDRFRDRIMFPIHDVRGRVIGFGARIIDAGEPKYLNSPETSLFHKSQTLYGLYQAKLKSRTLARLILVEGYLDVIALSQFAIPGAVATLGTATTATHIKNLLRYTSEVFFCYDGDAAGQKAAARVFETVLPFISDEKHFRFLLLPAGDDPDTLVRKIGKEGFEHALTTALPFSDYFFKLLDAEVDPTHLEAKAQQAALANTYLAKIPDCVLKQLLQQRLSERLRLPIMATPVDNSVSTLQPYQHTLNRNSRTTALPKTLSPLQWALALMLQHPHLAKHLDPDELWLNSQHPGVVLLREIYQLLNEFPDYSSAQLLEHWRDTPHEAIINKLLKLEILIPETGLNAEFAGILQKLRLEQRELLIQTLMDKVSRQEISETERSQLQALLAQKI